MDQKALQKQLTNLLQAGDTIEVRWDCGCDEAIIGIVHNGQTDVAFGDAPQWVWDLDLYLMNLLNLPSAGEFNMIGKGALSLQEGHIALVCESRMKGYKDGEDEDWMALDHLVSEHSGTFQLFE